MGIFDPNRGNQQQPSPWSAIGRRLMGALMIAFVAWMIYLSQSETNPVTGERQHVRFHQIKKSY